MIAMPRFSIIIPAHNEELRIGSVLRDYAAEFADSEVIVVLNGCTDNTGKVVEAVAAEYPNVARIDIDAAVGKGGAVRAGFLLAKAAIVAYADADGATSARELRRMCLELGGGDCAIASRWVPGSKIVAPQPFQRRLASRVFNACVRILFGLPYRDTQCGAKVFRASVLHDALEGVQTSNLAFDVDLLYHLRERGTIAREIPIEWHDRLGSKVGLLSASPKMLSAIVRLRLRYSMFRVLIPLFDRLFPTSPLRVHHHLRILILNWRDPKHPRAGGAETYLHEMAKRWIAAGHHVEWLTAGFAGCAKHDVVDGVKITRVGNRATVYAAVPFEYLKHHRNSFDVIVDAENGIPFLSPLYSLKPKALLMFHVHRPVFLKEMPPGIGHAFAFFETKVMPLIYARVPFVAISADTKAALEQQKMTNLPIEVVRSGVDPECAPGAKSERPTILYVGRLQRYKRVALLISAMPDVLKVIPGARLVIAGTGDEAPRLTKLAADLRLGDAVTFSGFVDENMKRSLLRSAWAFVSPSSMEGWGITVAEALASGTPAVVYDVPGLREIVTDGESGFVLAEGSDLAAPLVRLLRDSALRERLCAGALERARAFSWDRAAEGMLDVLMKLGPEQYRLVRRGDRWHLIVRHVMGDSRRIETGPDDLSLRTLSLSEGFNRPAESLL